MVQRAITGFREGAGGERVAELACLHDLPLRDGPDTVGSEADAAVGVAVECRACDRAELPPGLTLLRTAGPWDHDTLPAGLQRTHRVAEGVWGLLRVYEGSVHFQLQSVPPTEVTLHAGGAQPIPPQVPHHVALQGPARLAVEFWGRPAEVAPPSRPPA